MWRVLPVYVLCFAVPFLCLQMKGESNHYATSLNILSSGDEVVKLTNHYTQPIEAYHYSYRCSNGVSIERVYDSHKNFPIEKALASGEASQFTLGAELADCAGGVDIVVYADGSYEGDPTGLKTSSRAVKGSRPSARTG